VTASASTSPALPGRSLRSNADDAALSLILNAPHIAPDRWGVERFGLHARIWLTKMSAEKTAAPVDSSHHKIPQNRHEHRHEQWRSKGPMATAPEEYPPLTGAFR
jgi:hypothetical protein